MEHRVSHEDNKFKDKFEKGLINPSKFNHRYHIRLAYIYLCENDSNIALGKIRYSIQNLISHYGLNSSKYHETMTCAWTMAIIHFMNNSESAGSFKEFISNNQLLLDHQIMFTHYSKSVLFSEEARVDFIDANLDPIPSY